MHKNAREGPTGPRIFNEVLTVPAIEPQGVAAVTLRIATLLTPLLNNW